MAGRHTREEGFFYDSKEGYFETLLATSHSVIPLVLRRYEFWLFMMLHLSVYVAYHHDYLSAADDPASMLYLDWASIKVISAFTTFFQVFYTNTCFVRYHFLHDVTRRMIGHLYETSFELSLHLKGRLQSHLRLSIRWLIVAVMLFFYQQDGNISEREWGELKEHQLIKASERQFLETIHMKQRSLLMLHWSTEVALDGMHNSMCKSPQGFQKALTAKVLVIRELQQAFMDTRHLPIPFQYYHFLKSMIIVNLTFWAYRMGVTRSGWAPLIYFCSALIMMGMAELAEELADPFGTSEVDFPVGEWLADAVENIVFLVECESAVRRDNYASELESEPALPRGSRTFNCLWNDGFEGNFMATEGPARECSIGSLEPRVARSPTMFRVTPRNSRNRSKVGVPPSKRGNRHEQNETYSLLKTPGDVDDDNESAWISGDEGCV